MDPDAAVFKDRIHEAFACPRSQSGRERAKDINHECFEHFECSAVPPVKPPEPLEAKAPEVKPDSDTDSAPAYQPPAQSPLPPGQGTRIDQLV